jgi:hypothetical protein
MATQNLRIDNGLSVGEIVIDATSNTITGLTTSAPSAEGDVANKKYVDDSISSATTINAGNSSVVVADSGTGTITVTADGGSVASFAAANTTITASNNINLTATGDVVIPANVGITFGSGEKIEGNNTDLTITSGAKINLSATSDVQIPNDVGVLFGTGGEKIESNGTNLTVTSTGALDLNVTGATTVSGELIVTGNFTVNGTTTTLNSTNKILTDELIELANGTTGVPANDAGIIIERGDQANAFIGFDESEDKFKMGTGTFTGASTGNLTITTGTLLANIEGNVTGDLTGTATAAQYSDVAERFASDRAYDPGTVVALGGAAEITAVAEEASNQVFGVVSGTHQAAFKMNGAAGTDETHPYIAMTGRVQVKVIGTVNKGDRLISASVPGYARAAVMTECTAFNVIGRALESKHTQEAGVVLAAVRVSH